jgi:hypothetical protein
MEGLTPQDMCCGSTLAAPGIPYLARWGRYQAHDEDKKRWVRQA